MRCAVAWAVLYLLSRVLQGLHARVYRRLHAGVDWLPCRSLPGVHWGPLLPRIHWRLQCQQFCWHSTANSCLHAPPRASFLQGASTHWAERDIEKFTLPAAWGPQAFVGEDPRGLAAGGRRAPPAGAAAAAAWDPGGPAAAAGLVAPEAWAAAPEPAACADPRAAGLWPRHTASDLASAPAAPAACTQHFSESAQSDLDQELDA